MQVAVDGDGRIAGLFFRPDLDAIPVPVYDSFDGLTEDLEALATAHVYVAEVADGACTTTYESPESAAAAPSGSIFKLVVLSAVVDAVAAGSLDWSDELVITDDLKSLPSGRLQEEPTGTKVRVREAAGLMISISDNTATDLLLDAMGEDRMQDTAAALELSDASVDPLLTTRQLFLLGWGAPDLADRWSLADAGERRQLLEQLPKKLSALDPAEVTTPVGDQGIGWFFTGAEVCRMHARLQEQADTDAGTPVREILAENPGVPAPDGVDYLAFKGGSVPGVLAYSFFAETAEPPARVLVVQLFGDSVVKESQVLAPTRGGLALLSQ